MRLIKQVSETVRVVRGETESGIPFVVAQQRIQVNNKFLWWSWTVSRWKNYKTLTPKNAGEFGLTFKPIRE